MKESLLQDRIRLALGRVPDLVLFRNNCGYDGEKRVRYGVGSPGGADLIGLYGGKFVAVEIKTPTGRQSDDQKRFQQLIEAKGGEYVILRSVEDAEAWVRSHAG
jgi:hypothetical protein